MRGSTHSAIGIASVSLIKSISMSNILINPSEAIKLAAAYVGALICDMDTGSSTISNGLMILKSKHFRQLALLLYFLASLGAIIYFNNTSYKAYAYIVIGITGAALLRFLPKAYRIFKKAVLVGISIMIMLSGIIYMQLPLVLIGAVIGALIFSPHRGYSHSLLAVGVCYMTVKYSCSFYGIIDLSEFFAIGMLSHIIADAFTVSGVTLLFPYTKKMSFPVRMRTGSPLEHIITIIAFSLLFIGF